MATERSDEVAEPAERRSAAAILDGTLGFVLLILTTALVAMIRNEFQPEVLLIAFAYACVMLLVARRHGWRVRDYVRRLGRTPTSDQSTGRDEDEFPPGLPTLTA